jgi:pyruvate/2-oxoglutarate dehydrogenase complex dihydrolipoamide acyltransferase (E2) component
MMTMTTLKDLNIPHMGSVENAKMLDWIVKEGEPFKEGDILYEIETDKTATEVEASEPGILVKQMASSGDEFKMGDRVGLWADVGTTAAAIEEALAAFAAGSNLLQAVEPPQAISSTVGANGTSESGSAQRLSPLVRKLAAEHKVDLTGLQGSGEGGRVTADDVLRAVGASSEGSNPKRIPHSLRRKTIAQRMMDAASIPTLTADMEIDLSALMAHRARLKSGGSAPSIMALIAHAAVQSLKAHPRLNAHWQEDAILQWEAIHLGIAVDTDDGLMVPVIRNAETLEASELTSAIADLAERARQGGLKASDLEGGTFTLSNPGALGPTVRAEALLNPPQIALLGLPGIIYAPKAVPDGEGWKVDVRPLIRPSLSFDHRALDGGPVIAFLNDLKQRIEAQ